MNVYGRTRVKDASVRAVISCGAFSAKALEDAGHDANDKFSL